MDTQSKWLKSILTIAVLGILYYVTARLGLQFSFEESNASPVWLANGLALAGVLFFGPRVWPAIWLGSFSANALDFWSTAAAAPGTALWVSAILACGNVAAVLAGWFFCHRWSEKTGATLCRGHLLPEINLFRFAGLALLIGGVSACIGTTVVCAAGIEPWSRYGSAWVIWWFGDATGILLVTSFLLAWARPIEAQRDPAFWLEATAAFSLLALTCGVIFSKLLPAHSFAYMVVAPLIWIASRLGSRAVASGLLFVAACGLWQTIEGYGPFASLSEFAGVLHLLAFLWVLSLMSMALGSTVALRQKNEAGLQKLADELEDRVNARTAELQHANEAVKQSEEWVRSAAEYFPGAFFIYNAQKRLIFANARATQFADRSVLEALGHANKELLLPEITGSYLSALESCLQSREPQTREATLALPRGHGHPPHQLCSAYG